MSERQVVRSNCHFCGYLCGLFATVENGRIVELAPDPSRYPYSEAVLAGCPRWRSNLEVLDAPERVNYPLKRLEERGSGRFVRVSWQEALDDIAQRLQQLVAAHGPQTLATAIGGPHATFWPLHRFMNLLGSPNNMGIGQICWNPRIWMDAVTFGWSIEADIDTARTGAIFLWGTNPAQSDNSAFWRSIISLAKSDIPLVVIDPRRTRTAAHATLHLAPKPGTDHALALAMMHVIVDEDLVDHAFIEEWCHGYDELLERIKPYTPLAASNICDIPTKDIIAAARLFAGSRPSVLVSGRGIDQGGPLVAPTHRLLAILRAITGNVDKQGAMQLSEMSDFIPEVELEMSDSMDEACKAAQLNVGYTPLQSYDGFTRLRTLTEKLGRRLPTRYLTSAHPSLVWKAAIEGDPYPVRALIVQATNPLLTYANTKRVFEALMSLDLLVVLDYYLTPTAQLADYVLPIAGALERPLFQVHGGVANMGYGGPRAVAPYYERKEDQYFWRELGIRMGQEDSWPYEDLCAEYTAALARAGVSWEEFCETGLYYRPTTYLKHEQLNPATGEARGFATTTGKVEIASEFLASLGGERIPSFPEDNDILAAVAQNANEVPAAPKNNEELTLITGARMLPYYASNFFQNAAFRASHPQPLATLSEDTARHLGFMEGDPIVISTNEGSAQFIVHLAQQRDDIVSVEYGWWYPEEQPGLPDLCGIWRNNANLLTSGEVREGEPMIGTWTYNGIPCTVAHA